MNIDIEELEKLPFRESRTAYLTRVYTDTWNVFDYRRGNKKYDYYKLAKRLAEANIGESFDLTFRWFCKQVPKWKQDIFLDKFSSDEFHSRYHYRSGYDSKYYGFWVDDNRLIQETKYIYDKKPFILVSPDYKTAKVYKSDDRLESWCRTDERRHRKFLGDETYLKVISGYSQEYSQNCAFAKQKKAEAQKVKRKQERNNQNKKYNSDKADWILCYEKRIAKEKEREKEREKDRIGMEALGFDSTSFKGIEYHGQKRKLK